MDFTDPFFFERQDQDYELDSLQDPHEEREASAEAGRKAGFTVVYGEPGRILLDLDTTEAVKRFTTGLTNHPELDIVGSWNSKSGGKHVVLSCDPELSFLERSVIAIELGSDPKREHLACQRHNRGVAEPWLLFMPKVRVNI